MSHQDGLGNNGTEPTGLTKPDDGDDRVQKKSENVAHAEDRIRLKKLKNSGSLGNSPTTGLRMGQKGLWICLSGFESLRPSSLIINGIN